MVRQFSLVSVVALAGLLGCESSSTETPGGTGTTTAYISCAEGSSKCPGAAACTTDKGAVECVELPAKCDGKVDCGCLGPAVCGEATCTDSAAGGALTCNTTATDTCTPGSSFTASDGCNTCTCPPSGKKTDAACTTLGCVTGPCDGKSCGDMCAPNGTASGKAAAPVAPGYCNAQLECVVDGQDLGCSVDSCTPGESFPSDDGCNTCTCTDSGKKSDAMCTEKACVVDPCEGKQCGEFCTPNSASGGGGAGDVAPTYCDAKGQCVFNVDPATLGCPDDSCKPGETFPASDGCNTCTCPDSGKKSEAGCTKIGCNPDPCLGLACGDMCVPSGGNAGGGGAAIPVAPGYCNVNGECITLALPEELGCSTDTCVPGETFLSDDGCNSCLCPASGKKSEGACTDMACNPDPCAGKVCGEACSQCPPGVSCIIALQTICDPKGQCVPGTASSVGCDVDSCVPGESYPADDGCNTCTCAESGKKSDSGCTKIACPDPDACTPGDKFQAADGCNTCTCGPSGKKADAACTEMACPIMCGGAAGTTAFPEPADTCVADADCAVVLHQINCCGTQEAWGISASAVPEFEANEAICEAQYPKCGCAMFQATADDGSKGWATEDFVAVCDAGTCKSQGATGCHAGLQCTNGALCLSPGASIGCGMCMQPDMEGVPTCTDDASCQATDPTAICVPSTIADCLCSPAMLCKPGCTSDASCAEGETCGADMHCSAKSCAADMDCPINFACAAGSCERKACSANAECDGFCVNERCHSAVGSCTYPPP